MLRQRAVAGMFFVAFLATAVAGCVGPSAVDAAGVDLEGVVPAVSLEGVRVSGTDALVWQGRDLAGSGVALTPFLRTPTSCSPESCERVPFTVDVPEGYWEENPGFVEVSIEWEHQDEDYPTFSAQSSPGGHYLGMARLAMHLRVLDADGNLVKDATDAFHYASIALIENLPPGDYIAEVEAQVGSGSYVGVVQIEPKVQPAPGDQLPDLAILAPPHVTLEHPIGREGPDPLVPIGRKGCDPDEAFEFGAVKCLRFATSFANLGPGRLELRLSMDESQKATTGEGQWAQRIYDEAGDFREVGASPASYHKVHGHYHILGLDISTVYHYDLESRTRGEPVGAGHKTGFCPVDSALVAPFALGTSGPVAYDGCCYMWGLCQLDTVTERGYMVALSPGWYDVYPWWRADQYVDVAGAPDGVYELETCANPDGFMLESRTDNNCASAVFRMTGHDIEVLDKWTQADIGSA